MTEYTIVTDNDSNFVTTFRNYVLESNKESITNDIHEEIRSNSKYLMHIKMLLPFFELNIKYRLTKSNFKVSYTGKMFLVMVSIFLSKKIRVFNRTPKEQDVQILLVLYSL